MTCIKATIQVPCELDYDEVWYSENGLIKVSKDGLWGYINEKGTIVIPIEYDTVSQSNNGLICVEKNGLYGLLDTNGNVTKIVARIIPGTANTIWIPALSRTE